MILVDDKTALMEEKDFKELLDYSISLPSGTIVGKRWKANKRYNEWYMGEYYDIGSEKDIGIRWRKIIVV